MKKLGLIAAVLALFAVFPIAGRAHDNTEEPEASETHTHDDAEEPEAVDARMERFEQVKKVFPVHLSQEELARLINRCVKAQQNLAKIHDWLEASSPTTARKYSLIELHLTAIQKRLVIQRIDEAAVGLLLADFQKLVTHYDAALLDYHNALDDVLAVGCSSEPQTFRSLLENAKAKRQVFVNSIESIKNFTRVDLKTSFATIRTQLKTETGL